MSSKPSTEQIIEEYFAGTFKAVSELYKLDLFGHALVIIYSSIDTFGLLDAPAGKNSATGNFFKKWCSKYLLPGSSLTVTDVDLWGARCAVLHAHMSASDLSRSGKARELAYFSGDANSQDALEFTRIASSMDSSKYCAVNYEDLISAFATAIGDFIPDLDQKCQQDPRVDKRLKNILHTYAFNTNP